MISDIPQKHKKQTKRILVDKIDGELFYWSRFVRDTKLETL